MLLLATQKAESWNLSLISRFFSIILAVAFVMFLAYFTTRMMAGARYKRPGGSNLKLIEGLSLGYQSSIQLLQAGEKYILLGVSKDKVTFLTEIPKEQITEPSTAIPFEKFLKAHVMAKNEQEGSE